MANFLPITLTLDRHILEHPRGYHLRRMRAGIWLYLDLLARLPGSAKSIEIDPAALGREMGLAEGAVRSWLGHLKKAGYLDAERLNGTMRVTLKHVPEAPAVAPEAAPTPGRFFTVRKLQDALGETGSDEALAAALRLHPDAALKRALAATLAVPETQIRRSRLALFLYLLKRHAHEA